MEILVFHDLGADTLKEVQHMLNYKKINYKEMLMIIPLEQGVRHVLPRFKIRQILGIQRQI